MITPCKIRLIACLVAALLAIGGLAARPAHAYAVFNPPSGPHYQAGTVLTEGLLLNPIAGMSSQWVNPPGGRP